MTGVSLNSSELQPVLEDYTSVIQNLRLIKKPGINVWSKQDDFWSEAAIGEDKEGRILFIYSRSPVSMYQLNRELLESGLKLTARSRGFLLICSIDRE